MLRECRGTVPSRSRSTRQARLAWNLCKPDLPPAAFPSWALGAQCSKDSRYESLSSGRKTGSTPVFARSSAYRIARTRDDAPFCVYRVRLLISRCRLYGNVA